MIVDAVDFNTLTAVFADLPGLLNRFGTLFERAINRVGDTLVEEDNQCIAELSTFQIFARLMLLNAELRELQSRISAHFGGRIVDTLRFSGLAIWFRAP